MRGRHEAADAKTAINLSGIKSDTSLSKILTAIVLGVICAVAVRAQLLSLQWDVPSPRPLFCLSFCHPSLRARDNFGLPLPLPTYLTVHTPLPLSSLLSSTLTVRVTASGPAPQPRLGPLPAHPSRRTPAASPPAQ